MSAAHLFFQTSRLGLSVTALAAVGAELRLRLEGAEPSPARALLQQVARAVDPALLEGADAAALDSALAGIRATLLEALELLDHPAAAPGWRHEDASLLEATGVFSRVVVGRIAEMAATRPDLASVLAGGGRFLDVGTGSGALAVAAARAWPAMSVLGIDVWAPSLSLARATVASSEVAARVELRQQSVLDLPEGERFSLIWLPAQFIPGEVVAAALPRLQDALEPGGWLVVGLHRIPADPLGGAAARVRIARHGGHPWQPFEIAARLEQCGLQAVEMLETPAGASSVIGRRG